jgi:peptidylprolyl isomerase
MKKNIIILVGVVAVIGSIWFSATSSTKEEKNTMNATLHTNQGDITIEFFDSQAPNTVANFVKLAKDGFYNGTKFHRVIKGFMIQGGDPLTKDDSKINLWGTGGPGYSFPDELGSVNKNNKNDAGTISMANSGPNTNGSQFFINVASNNFLDDKHTVFGRVTNGMDIVTKIENVPTLLPGIADRPATPVVIESISFK